MQLFIYRCPNTGYEAKGFSADDVSEDHRLYEPDLPRMPDGSSRKSNDCKVLGEARRIDEPQPVTFPVPGRQTHFQA